MDKRGKTKLSVLIISLLVISFSLYFVWAASANNVKTYDSVTKTVTVKNSVGEVANIKLNTPIVYSVIRGKDRLVAEFTIENYADASSVFNNLEFYDVKNNMKPFSREFNYKYKTYYNIEILDYETICKERLSINGSVEKYDCVQNQIGTNIEQRIKWNNFNEKTILPKGNITLGIFTDVLPNERVEWIPTLFGVRINEWASWTSGLNNSLVAYYSMDEGTGTTTKENVFGVLNMSLVTTPTWVTNGKHFNATNNFDYAGAGCLRNTAFNNLDGLSQGTISFWLNVTGTPNYAICNEGNCYILAVGHANPPGFFIAILQNLSIAVDKANNIGGVQIVTGSKPISLGRFYHVVAVYDGTDTKVYINGTLSSSGTASANTFYPSGGLDLLGWSIPPRGATATMDEVAIWNRSLSADEVASLYNDGAGIFYTFGDTIPPETSQPIITPSTPKSNQDLQCNATLTDDSQISLTAYWKWYKNDVNYSSGSTSVTNGTNSLITTLSVGNTIKGENWICEVTPYDGVNYGNATNSIAVTILNSAPTQTNPLLATLSGKNLSTENLTCYNQSTSDADNDAVVNIYNWYKNSQPLAVLNLPFEINANDYSGNDNNGAIYGASFTDGKVGKALGFDGVDDYVDIPSSASMSGWTAGTIEMWLYLNSTPTTYVATYADIRQSDTYRIHTAFYSTAKPRIALISEGLTNIIAESPEPLFLNTWYHVVGTFDASTDETKIWVNGVLKKTTTTAFTNLVTTANDYINLGGRKGTSSFNGSIDEVKVYPYALSAEQIQAHYNLEYNKIVSQETTAGESYKCSVTPNDGEEDGTTLNSSVAEIKWGITFNVTSGEDGSQISNFNINCNNSFSASGVNSPYIAGFSPGSYECNLEKDSFYDKKIIFNADLDKVINVKLSWKYSLTNEEHTWLEAIYNCLYSGNCGLYNLLLEINQTVGNIWENTKPTDNSVITFENITNKVVDSTHNLTIDYTVNIPIKAGYVSGTYLPVRVGFWFLDTDNTTCYNQGEKPEGVEEPYCQPLIIETLGQMGGSVSFTVKLHPSLPTGDYSIKRIIDIDPNNVWINYGQETIGSFVMAEGLSNYGIAVEKTGENNPSVNTNTNNQQQSQQSSSSSLSTTKKVTNIYNNYNTLPNNEPQTPSSNGVIRLNNPTTGTGGVIGTNLLSNLQFMFMTIIIGLALIVFIVSRNKIRLRKKKKRNN